MPVRRGRGKRGGVTRGRPAKRRRLDYFVSGSDEVDVSVSTNEDEVNNPSSSSESSSSLPSTSLNVLSSNIGSLVRIITNNSTIIWTDNSTSADSSTFVNINSSMKLTADTSLKVTDDPTSSTVPDSSRSETDSGEPSSQTSTSQSFTNSCSQSSNVESVSSSQVSASSVTVTSSDDTFVSAESQSLTSSQTVEETPCSESNACATSDQILPSDINNEDIESQPGPSQSSQSEDLKGKCDNSFKEDECPVCLQSCVHPAKLPCSHVFCYLCIKGIARTGQACPMCRSPIPFHFADHPELVYSQGQSSSGCEETDGSEQYCWFYQGRHGGWWQFEKRMSDEIEENHSSGNARFELMICGSMYIIDTISCIQYPKHYPTRSRRLLRELPSRVTKKGVAGIHGGNR